jgi:glycerophosphoryl diester phosphodiesterase
VEFDVRLAACGTPVVIHDATLERTAGGDLRRVASLTADELSQIDVGSWFDIARGAPPRFFGEGVPTLEAALGALAEIRGPLYIELKCDSEPEADALADAACEVLSRSQLRAQAVVKSFRLGVISRVRHALPGLQTAALFAPKIMRILRKEKYLINIASELGADHLSVHRALVSRKLARKAARAGLPVAVWTVDNPRWLARAESLGLHALITNDPERLVRLRDGR